MVSLTHIGLVRTLNEDRCVTQLNADELAIAVVADGMGGHNAGDIASEMAIELLMERLKIIDHSFSVEQCMDILQQGFIYANEQIYNKSLSTPELLGMGTTLIAVVAYHDQVIVAHIGDSRAYLIRGQEITQLTTDHTLVVELIKSGQISENDAENHPRKNILTRALGTENEVEIEIQCLPWQVGDVIMLCTDGLSGIVTQEVIVDQIVSSENFQIASKKLIQLALDAGGYDNITLALIAHDKKTRKGQ
jgi:serine/threonine protein phosphatase PrpC